MAAHRNAKPARTTIQDVAKKADVTIATVSHVINGTAKISVKTTERVREAIRELNYRPNFHAQALRRPIAKSIAYLVPDITSSYYSSFFSCFVDFAYDREFSVSAVNFQHNPKYEKAEIQNLLDKNYDAILLYNGYDDDESLEMIRSAGVPLILLDRYQEGFSSVSFDNVKSISLLVNLLKKADYTKIGYISESIVIQNLNDRYIGFVRGMQTTGLETDINNVLISKHPQVDNLNMSYQLMKERLSAPGALRNLSEVYIASSDLVAFGAMRAIREAGLSIPGDVAIVGCDNLQMSGFVEPPLTTIQQSCTEIATHAWRMLCRLLENPDCPPQTEVLSQQLLVRDSVIFPKEVLELPMFSDYIRTAETSGPCAQQTPFIG